ncbi:MAG: PAS domain S-box protein [Armatimonadetes bacterium]|nr:PAS domain S-box protein [Armatimonadota bacterium]
MRLGTRIARTMALAFAGLLIALVLAGTALVHTGFREAENEHAQRNVTRVVRAVEAMATDLDGSAQDWAYWDDTYAFARDRNRGYIASNLGADMFNTLKVDVLAILDNRGRLVWGGMKRRADDRVGPCPHGLTAMAAPGGPLAGEGARGAVVLQGELAVVASRPILTSLRKGPPRGTVVLLQFIGDERLNRLAERLLVSPQIRALNGAPGDGAIARRLGTGLPALVETRSASVIRGTGLIRDISGRPAGFVRVDLPREMYRVAVRTVGAFSVLVAVLVIAFAAAYMLLLRRQIIGRVESLGAQVARVDPQAQAFERISVPGSDELAELAGQVNGMLTRISEARTEATDSRRQYDTLFTGMVQGCALHEIICDEDGSPTDYRFLAVNPAFERLTGLRSADVIGKTAREVLPNIEPVWIERYGRVALSGEPEQFESRSEELGRWFEAVAYRPSAGRFACIFTDVTERHYAAEALRESEAVARRLLEQQTAMNRLALALGQGPSLTEVYGIIHGHVRELVDGWFFLISALDEERRLIVAEYAVSGDEVFDTSSFPAIPLGEPGTGAQSRVIHSGEPLYSPDHRAAIEASRQRYTVENDGTVHEELPSEEHEADTTRSAVYLPMVVAGKTVGIMQVQSRKLDAYTPQDIEVLTGLANVAAVAVQNARLREDLRRELDAHTEAEAKVSGLLAESDRSRSALLSILEDEKRVEATLRDSETRFELAFLTSPYAITITDAADGAIVDVNDGFTTIAGYTREEAMASSSIGLSLWADPEDRRRVVGALQSGETVNAEEHQFRCRNGRLITGLVSAHMLDLGGRTCILSSINDITDRKRAEDLLKVRLRLLEFAATASLGELLQQTLDEAERLSDSFVGFYHFVEPDERTLRLQAWSTRTVMEFCKAEGEGLHYSIDEAGVWADCVRERRAVIHNDYAALPNKKRLPEGHAPVYRELVAPVLRNNRVVAVLGVGNKETDYTDDDAQTITYLADVAWEIAERKRAEEERAQLQEQLNHALRLESIGRLAGGVAHDFNNMLMVILTTCELMETTMDAAGPMAEHVRRVRSSAARGASLTRQLLTYSRKEPLHQQVVALDALVSDVHDMLGHMIGEDIEVRVLKDGEPVNVLADRSLLEQALVNLVVNARDAMPGGGSLTIETGRVELDPAYARTHVGVQPGTYGVLAVSDMGTGMDEATKAHLFEPFFTTKATGRGTGLGLASAYATVHQSGGTIQVYSEPGIGTTMRLGLPLTDREPEPEPVAVGAVERGAGGLVMVVDDEESLREIVARQVEDLGYRTDVRATGADAIAAVEEHGLRPNALLTDVVMPGMSGPALAERLRATLPGLPVVFMSGYTDNAAVRPQLSALSSQPSPAPYLAKPFTKADLASAMAAALRAARSERRSAQVLMIDDDGDARELAEIVFRKRGHRLVGVPNAAAALEALAGHAYAAVVVDNNIAGRDAEVTLRSLHAAGHALPAIVYSGAADAVPADRLTDLNVIGIVQKSNDYGPLFDLIELLPDADLSH